MFHVPEFYQDLSLKLSEVLDDIGVNEKMIMNRRNATLLLETMLTVSDIGFTNASTYNFGSLSEGATTIGLGSDKDYLYCNSLVIVIQDFVDWQPGLINLLMVKDENTPPGYCQLQLIRNDLPLPHVRVENEHCVKVGSDKVLLKNTSIKSLYKEEHGPSNVKIGVLDQRDSDNVPAFCCNSWPIEAKQWFNRGATNIWPAREIKNFAEKSCCFVVPVGSKVSQNENLEWRISTSLAERSLMFTLNITQIRCYILLKMILKTYLNSNLSSFMCKTVLWYCIENTHPNLWKEVNLMKCLSYCLQRLYTSLLEGNCPHFIIPGNNLMARQFPVQVKYKLQEKLCQVIESNGRVLFGILLDDLGRRLQIKLSRLQHPLQTHSLTQCEYISNLISTSQSLDVALSINYIHDKFIFMHDTFYIILQNCSNVSKEFIEQRLLHHLHKYLLVYRNGNILEKISSSLLAAPLCSTLGTIKASLNLQTNSNVYSDAFNWLHAGLNSDVSSGRLKLASVLFCMGDMVRTEVILREAERKYDFLAVEPACQCQYPPCNEVKREFMDETYLKDITYAIRENIAFCVRFTSAEINCIPHELRYEMFRSIEDDSLHINMEHDYWMGWAVADSLPYLYFLQYKTYGQLQRFPDQQQALNKLVAIVTLRELRHRETALNLLGQCMERENRIQDALQCYTSSLHVRHRNNVARIHICKLVANFINRVQR